MTIPVDLKPIDELDWREAYESALESLKGDHLLIWEMDLLKRRVESTIEAQASLICEAIAHVAEQGIHAATRIQDGKEMGAAVWRIALEDIVRENEAFLRQLKGES